MDWFLNAGDDPAHKFLLMIIAIALFVVVMALILFVVDRRRNPSKWFVAGGFVGPALLLLAAGLLYPAVGTLVNSFQNRNGSAWIGLDNYVRASQRAGVPARPGEHRAVGAGRAGSGHRSSAWCTRWWSTRAGSRTFAKALDVPAHGHLHGRRAHHLAVRLRVQAGAAGHRADRPPEPADRLAGRLARAVPAGAAGQHLLADGRAHLDPDGLLDDPPLGIDHALSPTTSSRPRAWTVCPAGACSGASRSRASARRSWSC